MRRSGPPRTYELDEDFFRTIDCEEKAYWLGFAFADGSVVQSGAGNWWFGVELQRSDEDHLAKLAKALQTDVPIRPSHDGAAAYLRICSIKLVRDLKRLGCIPNKTYGHPVPQIRKHLLRHFFRGLTDGDGSLFLTRGTWRYDLIGTPEMVRFCQDFLVEELNLGYTKLVVRGPIRSLRYTGNWQVRHIADLLYENSTVYLDRKMKTYHGLVA